MYSLKSSDYSDAYGGISLFICKLNKKPTNSFTYRSKVLSSYLKLQNDT